MAATSEPPPDAGSPASRSLLRQPGFVRFWCARVASMVGMQIQAVAVGWQMYQLTGSALDLGLVGFAQFVPNLLLVLVAGHVADRYDRRRVALIALGCAGTATAVLAIATAAGALTPGLIFAMVFLIGAARAFEHPSVQTLLPRIVPPATLPRAVAASSSAVQIAVIGGPALGGLLFAISPTLVLTVGAIAYVGAGLTIAGVPLIPLAHPPRRDRLSFELLFGGIAFLRRSPVVLGSISLDLFAVLLGGATALLPIFAHDVFDVGPSGLGALRAAPAIGALAMALTLARWPVQRRVGLTMLGAVALYGVATVVFALSTSFVVALAALAAIGAFDMVSVVIRQTLVQLWTPDEMRGRVYAVNSLFIGTSNQLGEFESGVTAAWFGAVGSVLIGGIGTLLVVLLWAKLFPQLRRADSFAPPGTGGQA